MLPRALAVHPKGTWFLSRVSKIDLISAAQLANDIWVCEEITLLAPKQLTCGASGLPVNCLPCFQHQKHTSFVGRQLHQKALNWTIFKHHCNCKSLYTKARKGNTTRWRSESCSKLLHNKPLGPGMLWASTFAHFLKVISMEEIFKRHKWQLCISLSLNASESYGAKCHWSPPGKNSFSQSKSDVYSL